MATEIFRDPDRYEIIGGKKFIQLSDTIGEGIIKSNLAILIGWHARTNKLGCQFCNLELDFSPENIFRPDFVYYSASTPKTVFDNIKKTIDGVPDMVAEVFSRSTMKRDIGIKKDTYERNGVKEYWMIDPWRETVEVYLLARRQIRIRRAVSKLERRRIGEAARRRTRASRIGSARGCFGRLQSQNQKYFRLVL